MLSNRDKQLEQFRLLDSNILLCDEPTAGLEPITSTEISELIKRMQDEQSLTSIVVTQSTRTISTAVALLHKEKILMQRTFDHLVRSENPLIHRFMQPVV